MSYEALIVTIGIVGMLLVLLFDKMRPGFTLLSGAILFMVTGVITPEELLAGFSNKEMVTIAMLFLVGEGVRQSGSLRAIIRFILPTKRRGVAAMLGRILPFVSAISMVLNNTAVVIILAPIIKRWADKLGTPATKFLIPLSYATILGGMCTLIGTSTNMVVNGLMQQAGYRSFNMFELGKVGGVIALVGLLYIILFGNKLLPNNRTADVEESDDDDQTNRLEILLMARFPGAGLRVKDFNFERHYGAKILGIMQKGIPVAHPLEIHTLTPGDTLIIESDSSFASTWRETSAFYILSGGVDEDDNTPQTAKKRWLGFFLLMLMIVGATIGDNLGDLTGGIRIDMFLLSSLVVVVMAILKLFPAKRYTKFISWDILIAIAAAFALSRAMINSGISDMIAGWILSFPQNYGGYGILALLYLVTMLLTELITNSAAVAIAFPVALALSRQMGIDPMPLFVGICIAASASFSSPIGYHTNLIVQGVGGYKFKDYLRIGIWLNIITFLISVSLIPKIWEF